MWPYLLRKSVWHPIISGFNCRHCKCPYSTRSCKLITERRTSIKKPRLLSRLPIPVHENIYTIPNILTFSRLIAAPMVGYFILHSNHVAALSLFAYASITDLVDGYIARKYNLQTVVGTVIDPMADKTLMTVAVVTLAMNSSIPG